MFDKIVLAGGSGYLGRVLTGYYKDKAKEIIILSRRPAKNSVSNSRVVLWNAETLGDWQQSLEGADVLINLCGKNVNCRYTEANKAEIFRSRLVPTELLGRAIAGLAKPPTLWINLASATIYRHAEDGPQDEETGEIGTGFSVDVCKAWENSFWKAGTSATRKVALRTGIVLGRSDGVFPRLKRLVLLGLGGHQGTGVQRVSWLHEIDFARITEWIYNHPSKSNVYNATAPEIVTNRELISDLRKALGVPIGLPSPQWLLELGAKLIGTETELILKSRWVYPRRLLDEGFRFSFPKVDQAVHEIVSTRT